MKVGDIFVMTWGYDQTNNDFYRVKALRGKTQAVVQEVNLKVEHCAPTGPMAADYRYNPKDYTITPRSVFINDNEKGRIVKIQTEEWCPSGRQPAQGFRIEGHWCAPYKGEALYESWYA